MFSWNKLTKTGTVVHKFIMNINSKDLHITITLLYYTFLLLWLTLEHCACDTGILRFYLGVWKGGKGKSLRKQKKTERNKPEDKSIGKETSKAFVKKTKDKLPTRISYNVIKVFVVVAPILARKSHIITLPKNMMKRDLPINNHSVDLNSLALKVEKNTKKEDLNYVLQFLIIFSINLVIEKLILNKQSKKVNHTEIYTNSSPNW